MCISWHFYNIWNIDGSSNSLYSKPHMGHLHFVLYLLPFFNFPSDTRWPRSTRSERLHFHLQEVHTLKMMYPVYIFQNCQMISWIVNTLYSYSISSILNHSILDSMLSLGVWKVILWFQKSKSRICWKRMETPFWHLVLVSL